MTVLRAHRLQNTITSPTASSKTLAEEVPATRLSDFVTTEVTNVSDKIISADVAKLTGKARVEAIEKKSKSMIADCEKKQDSAAASRLSTVVLEFYQIKQMEIKDVRLVHAPAEGVGKFGGDTDNWMWPRHTGDYGFIALTSAKMANRLNIAKTMCRTYLSIS